MTLIEARCFILQKLIERALLETNGNVCDSARMLGISNSSNLFRELKKLNINPNDFRVKK